jgi:hypothetical protein
LIPCFFKKILAKNVNNITVKDLNYGKVFGMGKKKK